MADDIISDEITTAIEQVKSGASTSKSSKKTKEDRLITLRFKESTLWKGTTFLFAALLILSIATSGFGFGGSSVATDTIAAAPSGDAPAAGIQFRPISVSIDDDDVLGNPDAPVTIIEFSDYQCPFCRRQFTDTVPTIKAQYVDTGKVKWVYRDFPLNFHPGAQPYAEAAECAGDQDKYWDMHDKIFSEQVPFGGGTVPYAGPDVVKQWAADIGLDAAEFASCFDSGKYTAEVQKDFADGAAAGVTGTPGTLIGNDDIGYFLVSGAQPVEAFAQVIEAALAS